MIKSVQIKFTKYIAETNKAYLVKYQGQEVWIPRSLCRGFAVHGNDMHGVVEIPSFFFEKITGINPNDEYCQLDSYGAKPSWIVEKHKPEKVSFTEKETKPDASLIK